MVEEEALTELTCVECGQVSNPLERGWHAHRVDLEEIAFYCPECAEREFGDS
jgi:Zn finger protein HypA/HybF involved in hydrogenase expression